MEYRYNGKNKHCHVGVSITNRIISIDKTTGLSSAEKRQNNPDPPPELHDMYRPMETDPGNMGSPHSAGVGLFTLHMIWSTFLFTMTDSGNLDGTCH